MPTGWKTAAQLQAWLHEYEIADVRRGSADLGGTLWPCCISSDARRAYLTATAISSGPIIQTDLAREVEFAEFRTGRLRLPVWAWGLILRLSWVTGHRSQRACRDGLRRRVLKLADQLEESTDDTLVVSHAGLMMSLSAELRRRGFTGPRLGVAKHAQVYVYERMPKPVPEAEP